MFQTTNQEMSLIRDIIWKSPASASPPVSGSRPGPIFWHLIDGFTNQKLEFYKRIMENHGAIGNKDDLICSTCEILRYDLTNKSCGKCGLPTRKMVFQSLL